MTTQPAELPLRLATAEPGWTVETDIMVVGSGIAGLSTALRYLELAPAGRVVLVTKDEFANGSTRWAQGGIAAVVDPCDAPLAHMVDTMAAGRELCSVAAVRTLVTEGPEALRWLMDKGTAFDRTASGGLALTREGGHRADRIAHAGGDATGAEIQRALTAAVRADPRVSVIEHAFVPDLLLADTTEPDSRGDHGTSVVLGATVHVMGEGEHDGVGEVRSRAVVLATGGIGQTFAATTNPEVSTGDGVALGLRAGCAVQDLEFVQFHPTVLWLGPQARGRQPLISEAVRGEGAFLVATDGRRVMSGRHEHADLAPRDVVSQGIAATMARTGADHVLLDARHFGADTWQRRFPTILAACRSHGIDPVAELIPVAPAAHYASGGLWTDLNGMSDRVDRLYAVGEVACTGVHGANRLASNSLLESVVFAHRAAAHLSAGQRPDPESMTLCERQRAALVAPALVPRIRTVMSRHLGVVRDPEGLRAALTELAALAADPANTAARPGTDAWEAANLLTVALTLTRAALHRTEHLPDRGSPGFGARRRKENVRVGLSGRRWTRPREWAPPPPALAAEINAIGADSGVASTVVNSVHTALREDLGGWARHEDVTSAATVPAAQIRTADLVARADGVVCGLPVAEFAFWSCTEGVVETERRVADGDTVRAGDILMSVTARTRDLLTAERTALNFLTHLSGVATATRAWVEAVAGTKAAIRDSRKTHPGLRALEKYAVRCGGGVNHRFGLTDAALIKDNHVVASGGVAEAVHAVRERFPGIALEVEVDRIDQIEPAIKAGAEEILLDNFGVPGLAEAVTLVDGRARLESSGGLSLADAAAVAGTGVDYLSVGALTHSSPALDIALDLRDH